MKLYTMTFALIALLAPVQGTIAGPHALLSQAEDPAPADGGAANDRAAALLRQNNITSTGATVPHPGASQSAGPTPLDRDIDRLNDKIDRSICKGC